MKFSFAQNNNFFSLLEEQTKTCLESSLLIKELCENFNNIKNINKKIKENEHKSDDLMRKIAEELNLTFITPIDREDIYFLASMIDDIMDYIDELSLNFSLYNVKEIKKEAIELSENLIKIIKSTSELVSLLNNMKQKDLIEQKAQEVNKFENIADEIYYNSVANLFKFEKDPIEVIRWEKIYTTFENIANQCKEVTNTINKILIKHT